MTLGQLRKRAKVLAHRIRAGDSDAAGQLLNHSIKLGHGKLAIHRFFLARAMGAKLEVEQVEYCAALLKNFPAEAVENIARIEAKNARSYLTEGGKQAGNKV